MQHDNDAAQSSDGQHPDYSDDPDNDLLYICRDCTTLTYADVEACPACGSERDSYSLAFVNAEGQQ
jgi:rubrerythrin